MLQEEWDVFQHVLYRITATLAVSTNTIMIYLIVHFSPKSLGAYKYLMIGICLFEVLYELVDLAASPDIYTKDSAFLIIISDQKALFPVSMLLGINLAYCACFGVSLTIFAVHFVYRYLVLIGNRELTRKSVRNIVMWQVIPLSVGVFWMISAWYFDSQEELLDRMLKEEVKTRYGVGLERVAYVGPYLYPLNDKGKEIINWKAIHGMILFVVLISISLSTMTYFGVKSYLKINSVLTKTARSSRFKTLQSQLLLALILQSVIPLTLMHFPSGICFLVPFFKKSRDVFGRILTVSISIYPVLDPLPNMFLIKEYRRALLDTLRINLESSKGRSREMGFT